MKFTEYVKTGQLTEYVNMDLFIAQTEIKKLETGERGGVGE